MVSSLVVAFALAAAAQDCRQAYEQVRYKDAIALCSEAIATAPREQLAELYRLLGLSLASQGDHARAKAAFASLLAVDPAATVSESYSPRLRADFEAARQAGAGAPVQLAVEPKATPFSGEPVDVHVTVDDGAAKPVTAVQLQSEGTDVTLLREGPLDATLSPSAEPGTRELTVSARDAFGGVLSERRLNFEVHVRPHRPAALSWKLWGAVAVAGGIAGGVLGVLSRIDGSNAHTAIYGDTQLAFQQQANTFAVGADVCFAAAGALALAALILLLTAP